MICIGKIIKQADTWLAFLADQLKTCYAPSFRVN